MRKINRIRPLLFNSNLYIINKHPKNAPHHQLSQVNTHRLFATKLSRIAPRHDPAPSRMKYRLYRLWLKLSLRHFSTIVWVVIILLIAIFYVGSQKNLRNWLFNELKFVQFGFLSPSTVRIESVHIVGGGENLYQIIENALNLELPLKLSNIDLEHLHQNIESLKSIKTVEFLLNSNNHLKVVIEPRTPVVLMRNEHGLHVFDQDGVKLASLVNRVNNMGLPLIAGLGAEYAIDEALMIFSTAGELYKRIRGLHRRGERRWDIILDRNQIIQLPENNPVDALERLLAWQTAFSIMHRDISHVDLRDMKRPYIRLKQKALNILRVVRTRTDTNMPKINQ